MTTRLRTPIRIHRPPALPSAGSIAIRPLVRAGPRLRGQVLGSCSWSVWIEVAGRVLVVSTADGVRLPNAVVLGEDSSTHPLDPFVSDAPVQVGQDEIRFSGLTVEVVRWWDPRPRLPRVSVEELSPRVATVGEVVGWYDDEGLGEALERRDQPAVIAAAGRLFGKGEGLTPEGDDLVSGAMAAVRLLGEAVEDAASSALAAEVAPTLIGMASASTTALAATLVRHACRGEVAVPVGDLLMALVGRGEMQQAIDQLVDLGHTSGVALAAGIVAGAGALAGFERA